MKFFGEEAVIGECNDIPSYSVYPYKSVSQHTTKEWKDLYQFFMEDNDKSYIVSATFNAPHGSNLFISKTWINKEKSKYFMLYRDYFSKITVSARISTGGRTGEHFGSIFSIEYKYVRLCRNLEIPILLDITEVEE